MNHHINTLCEDCKKCQENRKNKEQSAPISKYNFSQFCPMDAINADLAVFKATYYFITADQGSGHMYLG